MMLSLPAVIMTPLERTNIDNHQSGLFITFIKAPIDIGSLKYLFQPVSYFDILFTHPALNFYKLGI